MRSFTAACVKEPEEATTADDQGEDEAEHSAAEERDEERDDEAHAQDEANYQCKHLDEETPALASTVQLTLNHHARGAVTARRGWLYLADRVTRTTPALLLRPRLVTYVLELKHSRCANRAPALSRDQNADDRLRGCAGPREKSASAAVQSLPAGAARAATRPRLDAAQPAAPPPSGAGRQPMVSESILAASVGQPDREAPGGLEGAQQRDERLRPHPARRGVGRGAGGRCPSCVENKLA